MGVWQTFKRFFAPAVVGEQAPDYTRFSDERLVELWAERDELTEVAHSALVAERAKRGLVEDPATSPPRPARSGPRRPPGRDVEPVVIVPPVGRSVDGDVLMVRERLGVLLRTTPGRWALVHLPLWDPTPPEFSAEFKLDAIIVCNQEPRGWLFTTSLARAAGLPEERVLAVAEGAIDRSVGSAGGRAALLAESSAIGSLWLDRTDVADVLAATWAGAPAQATIGPLLPPLDGRGKQVHVGSLAPPDRTMAWRVLLMAAHASAVMKIAGADGGSSSPVLLLGDAVGAHPEDHGFGETGLGVQMVGKVCPVGLSAIGALGCVLAGRWDLLGPTLRPAGVAAELARYLLIEGRLDDAGRVLACARTTRGDELLACEAILAALAGDPDAAIEACRRALTIDPADTDAQTELASLLAGRRDFDDALAQARRAVEVGNGWPETVTLCRVLWLADRADEARATLDRLAVGIRASLVIPVEQLLDGPPPSSPEREALQLPALAQVALRLARRASGRHEGERFRQRALAVDPYALGPLVRDGTVNGPTS